MNSNMNVDIFNTVQDRLQLEERILNNAQPLVLAVDDNEDQLYMLREALEPAGFGVIDAADGKEGLSSALRFLPEIVITDTNMSEITGPDLVSRLLNDYKTAHPLGRNPLIIGTSNQGNLHEGQFSTIVDERKDISTVEELYTKLLGVLFYSKDDILEYISTGKLNTDFSRHNAEQAQKPTILLVEDNLSTLKYLNTLLYVNGYNVITAKNSEEALRKARTIHRLSVPYTIITDTDLEYELDGLRLAREVKVCHLAGNPLVIGMSETSRIIRAKGDSLGIEIPTPFEEIELGEAYRHFGAARFVHKSCQYSGIRDYIQSGRLINDLTLHKQGYDLARMRTTESGAFRLD